ncbi:hypothetical protein FQN54_003041 [Arachnomyces sp. PD_36]|nr:hypothetical protein FQN54_003041 [Arachnomyces sp. PD_36]
MGGHPISLKWTALYLILISICCNLGYTAAIERALVESPQECSGYDDVACSDELVCANGHDTESSACPEPNESSSCDHDQEHIAKRGDGNEPRAYTPISGASGMAPRLPVMVLKNQNPDIFNMLLLALERVQNWPEDRELSWFQMSGIHGLPFTPWQYPSSATVNPGLGYCPHSSGLFLPWHAPYLLLMEQILWQEAGVIARQFTGAQRTKYINAANRVRLPYWDWSSAGSQSRIPPVLKQSTITVVKPAGTRTIHNPLFNYRFLRGAPPGSGMADTTRRGPDDNRLAETFPGRVQSTLDLFTRGSYNDAQARLEGIHNNIHVFLGGDMPFVYRSSFDPVFWLHHVNVDRLRTMYQATHPGVVLQPQSRSPTFALGGSGPDTLTTPLYPFRHSNGREWTPNDVRNARDIHTYGYSYPEVPPNLAQPDLSAFTTQRINELYRPNLQSSEFQTLKSRDDSNPEVFSRLEWNCNVQYDTKELSGPSYQILFYLDLDGSKHLVGAAGILAGMSPEAPMADTVVTVDIPLTHDLLQPTANLSSSEVVPFLTNQLSWTVERVNEDGSISPVPVEDIPSLKIATFSTVADYPADISELPTKGNETIFLDPTKGKDGGLSPGDNIAPFVEMIGNEVPEIIDDILSLLS